MSTTENPVGPQVLTEELRRQAAVKIHGGVKIHGMQMADNAVVPDSLLIQALLQSKVLSSGTPK